MEEEHRHNSIQKNQIMRTEWILLPMSLYQTITEEGAQKQFNSKEFDNEVSSSSDDPTIMKERALKQFNPEESGSEE